MLQMAAAVTQCGGIFPTVSPNTMANMTGNLSNTNLKMGKSNSLKSPTSITSTSLPLDSQSMHVTPTTATTSPNDSNKSIGDTGNPVPGGEASDVNTRENMERALMQLYGMGQGINSFPSGVAQANPFLHPTMFSATGKCNISHK